MKVFVAGATGAVGRQLLPQLTANGHEVTGMARDSARCDLIRSLGATPVVADALDAEAVARAVSEVAPEAIVHQLTALPTALDVRHFERDFALTNRLRTEGTDHLLTAGRATGVRRSVAHSFAGWPYARSGGPVKNEDDPLDPAPPKPMRTTLEAIRHLEDAVLGADWTDGIVLRCGNFYGPGTGFSASPLGAQAELIRARRLPVIGAGSGVWSFVHVEDAAAATVAALERGRRGLYNIVDDDSAPVSEWLPAAAEALGAKHAIRVPRWAGRLAAGEVATIMMTEVRGASNAKAKRELGWRLRYPCWRQGFVDALG